MTSFSKLTTKDFAILQGISCYKRAWRSLSNVRDSCGVKVLLVCHLAKYWDVEEAAIIAKLTNR
jgi:hypothetical protein